MLRSEINAILCDSIEFCNRTNFSLPPFALWTPEHWGKAGHEYDEIRDNQLGWDITDFGRGDFARIGLVLFTVRNGNPDPSAGYEKPYCEKLLLVGEEQRTPFHYHVSKMEDIICRAGGNLLVEVYNRSADDKLDDTPVAVNTDGRSYQVDAGTVIRLTPGESISLPAYLYHEFWAEAGSGMSLVGEVSKVNDDLRDNFFLEEVGRFPAIEEDEPPVHLLCNEYPSAPD
jgi:D-lyxose ketol-isomerase